MVRDCRLSPAVEAGGFFFLTGMTGARATAALADDAERWIAYPFDTIAKVLVAA